MAWEDKPTEKQLSALWNFMNYHAAVTTTKVDAALKWLEEHATRKQVSDELGRVRDLDINRKLNAENIFESEVWNGFEFDGDEPPTEKQAALVFAILNKFLPFLDATLASHWLKFNATKKQVAIEIDRLKKLQEEYKLDKKACFSSNIWRGYERKGDG